MNVIVREAPPGIPLGCICSYTWHSACDGRIARNGALLSCPADHADVDGAPGPYRSEVYPDTGNMNCYWPMDDKPVGR